MTDLKAFKIKHIYDQLIRVNHILFYIPHLLFKAVVGDFLVDFYLKYYCYKSRFYNIFNFFLYNIFFILKIISNIVYKLKIRCLFFL